MRKEYDFSRGARRNPYAARARSGFSPAPLDDDEVEPLTRAQIRELDRRIRDSGDRTRYLLVSQPGRRFLLYYNVSDDVYVMNDARHATLFKRRAAAVAIRSLISPRVRIVRCRVDRRGRLVVASLPIRVRRRPRARKGAV